MDNDSSITLAKHPEELRIKKARRLVALVILAIIIIFGIWQLILYLTTGNLVVRSNIENDTV